jgi:iron complex transport system ATP-binding protein
VILAEGFLDLRLEAERNYSTLSGGERQRVNFARVLAQIWRPVEASTRYLFLDEPLTFLDIRHQLEFMTKVREFAGKPDVIVIGVVHDLNLAAKFGRRLLLLHNGRIVAHGTASDVLSVENLHTAFGVKAIQVTDSSGHTNLVFE